MMSTRMVFSVILAFLLLPSLVFGATFTLTTNQNEANRIGAGEDGVIGSFYATGTSDGKVTKIVLDARAATIPDLTMETDDIASVSLWVDVNQNGVLERDIDTLVDSDNGGTFGAVGAGNAAVTMALAVDDQVAVANGAKVYFIVVITTAEVPQSADKTGIIDVNVTLTDATAAMVQINAAGAAWYNDVLNFTATKLSFVGGYLDLTTAVGAGILTGTSSDLLHAVDDWGNRDTDFVERIRFLLYQYETGDRITANFTATANVAGDDVTWGSLNDATALWITSPAMVAGVLQQDTVGAGGKVKSIKYSPPDGLEDNLVLVARTQVSELEGSVTLRNGVAHQALTGLAPSRGIEIYDVNYDGHIDHATIFFNAPVVAGAAPPTIANFTIGSGYSLVDDAFGVATDYKIGFEAGGKGIQNPGRYGITLRIMQKTDYDTDAIPNITFIKTSANIDGVNGGTLATFSLAVEVDKARPFLVKAATKDNGTLSGAGQNGMIDNIVLTFSEIVRNVTAGPDTTNTGLVCDASSGLSFTGERTITDNIVTLGVIEMLPNTGQLPDVRVNQAPDVRITDFATAATGAISRNSFFSDPANTGAEASFTTRDEAPMVVHTVKTLDNTGDGRLDNILVIFSEDALVPAIAGVGFYSNISAFSSGTNNNSFYDAAGVTAINSNIYSFNIVPVELPGVYDSEALPFFSYSAAIGNITDIVGNELPDYGPGALISLPVLDGAPPVAVSIKTGDAYSDTAYWGESSFEAEGANGRIDKVTITFSEKVKSMQGAQLGGSALDNSISQFTLTHSLGSLDRIKINKDALVGAPVWTDSDVFGETKTDLVITYQELPFGISGMVNNGDTGSDIDVVYEINPIVAYNIIDYAVIYNNLSNFSATSTDGAAPYIVNGIGNGWSEYGFANILTYDADGLIKGNTTDTVNGDGYLDGFVLKFSETTVVTFIADEAFSTSLDTGGLLSFNIVDITLYGNGTPNISVIGTPNELSVWDTDLTPLLSYNMDKADIKDASGNEMGSFTDRPSFDGTSPVITQVYPGLVDTELIVAFSENIWGHYPGGQHKDIDSLFVASSVLFGYSNNEGLGASGFTAAFVKKGESGNKIIATLNAPLTPEDISGDQIWIKSGGLFDDANAGEPAINDNEVEWSIVSSGYGVSIFENILPQNIIDFIVTTGADSIQLHFGLHPTATDGIDSSLGEDELPPKPPAGVFDIRFTGPELGNGTWTDIRNSSVTSHEYVIDVQRLSNEDVTFEWDSLAGMNGAFLLKDTVTGTLVNIDMKTVSQYTITNSAITQVKIVYHSGEWVKSYNAGWDMVSLGLDIEDKTLSSIFPSAISLYEFNNGYQQITEFEIGNGYWLNLSAGINETVYGAVIDDLTLDLPEKWSMIGTISNPITVAEILQNPSDNIISIYGYNGSQYVKIYPDGSDLLEQGKGYWINMGINGSINLTASPVVGKALSVDRSVDEYLQESFEIPLTITSSRGQKTISFYVADNPDDAEKTNRLFEMPPVPPFGSFDERIACNNTNGLQNMLIDANEDFETSIDMLIPGGNDTAVISWSSDGLPVNTYFLRDGVKTVDMALVDRIEFVSSTRQLTFTQTITAEEEKPAEYYLNANYPNPFNPETTITYSIKSAGLAQLTIFNILGQEVRSMVHEPKQPGVYTVRWDGRDMFGKVVSGGLYLYRLKVNDFVETKKMLLMK